METIRLLANVGEDAAGAVISVTADRARRLIRTGYAERVELERKAKKGKE
jgi:hypothetical protein